MVLSLSSISNIVCFDTGCYGMLYDSSFFQAQIPNTPIRKIIILVTVKGIRANKHTINKYAIIDIYILAKNSQR